MTDSGIERAIGVGHSLGGALTVLAAAANAKLFRGLVLVDPVIFTGLHALFWGTLKGLGFGHRLPLIRGARKRRERFPSLEAVRVAYEGKSVFSTWDARVLDDYVQAGFREGEGGDVVLRYSRAWEARIFELTPASVWSALRRLTVPTLCIRGASSDTFLASAAQRVGRELPAATVLELPGTTHFLPMEQPEHLAETIFDWFSRIVDDA